MSTISERLRRKFNDLEIERDLARYFSEDGEIRAAVECFRSAQYIMREIEALFTLAARTRALPTFA